MNKLRLLTIFASVMLLINICLIGYMLNKKEGRHRGGKRNPVEIFSKELNFNEAQKAKLEILVNEHVAFMEATKKQAEPIKSSLRKNIIASDSSINVDSLLTELSVLQSNVEREFHQHFKDIKSLCKEEQLTKFEQLLEKTPNGRRLGNQPPPPNKR